MRGGRGADQFILGSGGVHLIYDYKASDVDQILFGTEGLSEEIEGFCAKTSAKDVIFGPQLGGDFTHGTIMTSGATEALNLAHEMIAIHG